MKKPVLIIIAGPQLLFKVTEGKLVKEYQQVNEWAQPILNFLNESHC